MYIYIYGKCLGFARNRNHDKQCIIITIIITKPFLKIFNKCRSLTGVGELKPLLKIFKECRSLTGVGEWNP